MNICQLNGIREPLATSHPSRGGKPYPREIRDQVIWRFNNNLSLDTAEINAMRADKKFPCLSTCNNWITQYVNEGNTFTKRHTGNKFADRKILGKPLERFALFWVVMPKATYAEARAYLHNTDPTVNVYSVLNCVQQKYCWIFHTSVLLPKQKSTHFGESRTTTSVPERALPLGYGRG